MIRILTKVPDNDRSFKSHKGANYYLGEFARLHQIQLPAIQTPVCYRGHFATIPSQIVVQYPKQYWKQLQHSLQRADNLEEGHFMELNDLIYLF